MEILRAFRPGSELLGNGDLVERTGLSKATVSRLTQTLVGTGLLQQDAATKAFRLGPAVLSLGQAMRAGSRLLGLAAPRMQELAQRERVNVGLAAADRDEMVYLESIRYARRVALRQVVSGQRVPMELTSLGRAYLAVAPAPRRRALLALFRARRAAQWPELADAIEQARTSVQQRGFCAAAWQPEVVAVAAPLPGLDTLHVLNVSISTDEPLAQAADRLAQPLLQLRADLMRDMATLTWER